MEFISDRVQRIAFSQTYAVKKKTQQLKQQGKDIIELSVGEPDFNTPRHIKEAGKAAIDDNFTFYTAVAGYRELREAIVEKFRRDNNLDYKVEQIVVSNGAKQALANVILSLINHDDEILVPAPYWVTYAELDNLAAGKNIFLISDISTDYKVTPEQIQAAITPKTRAFVFSSPANPSGSVYTREELRAIAEVFARRKDIYIISDEIYEHINYTGKHESIAQFDFIRDQVVIINGVSKAYSMTGWRIGYVAAPEWIAKSCDKLQGQYTSGACSIAQKAAYAALTGDQKCTHRMTAAFKKRRDMVLKMIDDIPGMKCNEPQGAFYVFPDISHFWGKSYGAHTINNTKDLTLYLLEEANVAVIQGCAFGQEKCIRISYAASEEQLTKAFKRIKEALAKLQ